MSILVTALEERNLNAFLMDMSDAFQYGYEHWDHHEPLPTEEEAIPILPQEDIKDFLQMENSHAIQAVSDGEIVGGAIYTADASSGWGDLLLLYTKVGFHNKGIGKALWNYIENTNPDITIWETFTPYEDKRNIHFYINKCGFSAAEFYNSKHPDPNEPEGTQGLDYSFRFVKRLNV